MNILQDIWSDAPGKIFLITFGCYLFGYLVYGGYIYTFLGRKGSIPFGLADFSIADLISIFPTAIITLINIVPKAIAGIVKGTIVHLFVPLVIAGIIRFVLDFHVNLLSIDPTLTYVWGYISLFIWLMGFSLAILQPKKLPRTIFVILEIIGAILFFITIPNSSEQLPQVRPQSNQTQQILVSLIAIAITLEVITLPYIFGSLIALTAIKSKLLIKIDRLTLRQPIFQDGIKKVSFSQETRKNFSYRNLWVAQRNIPVDIEPEVYEWVPSLDKVLYLIATFEKFVLIFVTGINTEDTCTFAINRDVILSLELSKQIKPEIH